MKYPCETCEHYGGFGTCRNPRVEYGFTDEGRTMRRYFSRVRGCGNGRRHSAYVSVWRRVWRWLTGTKPKLLHDWKTHDTVVSFDPATQTLWYTQSDGTVIKTVKFGDEPREAGLWR